MMKFCCDDMKIHVYCRDKDRIFDDGDKEDKVVHYVAYSAEYGIPIRDGENGASSSYIVIDHCPWCGKRISKKNKLF